MKNAQITIDGDTLAHVDRVAKLLGVERSEIVHQALRDWLRRRAAETFEREWISALRKNPDAVHRAEEWLGLQASSEQ
ncbi:MAG: ribbon-helix-helix protein, CopG family [Luteitalea sp.]|nr:ribbon-helix-helix protein, CopG family [Luteitalea sp.]